MSTETMLLDEAIVAALPVSAGSKVTSVTRHGETNWSTGVKIDVTTGDETKSFFAKLIEREDYVPMAKAEYEGQKTISAIIPDHAITPIAWGHYANDHTKAWFLTHFRPLKPFHPDDESISELLTILKTLHHASTFPTGDFGFHTTSFFGPPPMVVDWTADWAQFWGRELRSSLAYAQRMRGTDAELQELGERFLDGVVPRLLVPLQTGGRAIRAGLCHGDLWDGNIQVDAETGRVVLFDPCPFYGHCEMDLQCVRAEWGVVNHGFVKTYASELGKSEPEADFEDRVALYAIRNDLLTVGMYEHRVHLLERVKEEMRRLLVKHPDGLSGFEGDLTPSRDYEPESDSTPGAKL
ncbi:Fructosamine kinase-domain-containing protein [Chaetomium fimeti]|uniref:protein-ribulosamine 3-kinase n=1 Tax=Chaetomium fimeti TaxID=1854472 RepID=A0AAE0HNG7_9PEZI|nr:Fructosamine kinase-domain-containing protein [Chaetomium fimeti]